MSRNNFNNYTIITICIFLYTGITRLIFPNMDPASFGDVGTGWSDEGAIMHDARIKYLFGEWMIDLFHTYLQGPIFNCLHYIFFIICGGVSTFSVRIPERIIGILIVILYNI